MKPAQAPALPVQSAKGAVSVEPKPVTHSSGSPQTSADSSESSSNTRSPSPAAA